MRFLSLHEKDKMVVSPAVTGLTQCTMAKFFDDLYNICILKTLVYGRFKI